MSYRGGPSQSLDRRYKSVERGVCDTQSSKLCFVLPRSSSLERSKSDGRASIYEKAFLYLFATSHYFRS